MKPQTTPRMNVDVTFVTNPKNKHKSIVSTVTPKSIELMCPHCHFYSDINIELKIMRQKWNFDFLGSCRQCRKTLFVQGSFNINNHLYLYEREAFVRNVELEAEIIQVYPENKEIVADGIPERYKKYFLEAKVVLITSPDTTVRLCRRILQNVIIEVLKDNNILIEDNSLNNAIDEFIKLQYIPLYIREQVDVARHISYFTDHRTQHRYTGEKVTLELEEAEWLIILLDLLFDFLFVSPAKTKERIKQLKVKMTAVTHVVFTLKVPPKK